MISVEDAIELLMSEINVLGSENVDILSALGRTTAEDIRSPRDIPYFDHSAMDGYALKHSDIQGASHNNPSVLKVTENIRAGTPPSATICEREAARIMTGALVPRGADTVVMIEYTEETGNEVKILKGAKPGEHIRLKGEDVKAGDLVIPGGTRLRPAEVGMMSSVGRAFVHVHQVPRVAILCTGDELVDVDNTVTEGKIIATNRYTLTSQVKECGAIPMYMGIAEDSKEDIKRKLVEAVRADIIVTSAGISVGDYDLVRDVLDDLEADIKFRGVAMKPGRPITFGFVLGRPFFGLPGNPVSSMVSFEQFVRPSILKMCGLKKIFRPVIEAILEEDISLKPGVLRFLRSVVRMEKGGYRVRLVSEQGSGSLMSMVKSNSFIMLPADHKDIKAGDNVKVQLWDERFELEESPGYVT